MNAQAFQLLDAEFARQFRKLPTPTVVKPLTESDITRMDAYDAGVDAYVAANKAARIASYWSDIGQMQAALEEVASRNAYAIGVLGAVMSGDTAQAGYVLDGLLRREIARRAELHLRDEFVP